MTALEAVDMRIRITEDTLRKKQDYYHHVSQYGSEQQRKRALCDCNQLRGELEELIDEKGRLEVDSIEEN